LKKKRFQNDENSSQNLVAILISFFIDFGSILGRFWEAFGDQVGAMLGPNGIKT